MGRDLADVVPEGPFVKGKNPYSGKFSLSQQSRADQ